MRMTLTDLCLLARDLGHRFRNGTLSKNELVVRVLETQCSPTETPIERLMGRLWDLQEELLKDDE